MYKNRRKTVKMSNLHGKTESEKKMYGNVPQRGCGTRVFSSTGTLNIYQNIVDG